MARIPSRAGRSTPHPDALRRARERARAERAENTDQRPHRRRRRNRSTERSRAALHEAIQPGTRPAVHVAEWARQAKAHPRIDRMRADARARMHALIEHMAGIQGHAPRACTLLLAWDQLAATLAVCRRTVATMLRRLREAGLLCVVATGRRAEFSPQRDKNEAAIYGLTVPADSITTLTTEEPVDGTCTPPPIGVEEHHVRAHEHEFSERSRFAAQEMNRRRASRAAWHTSRAQRKAPLWSRHTTMAQDEGGHLTRRALRTRLHEMAMSLQEHAPDTRDVSTAHVASFIRPFALAGWTVADVQHALDWSPDGTRHWQAANGMGRIDAWMRRRLALWLTTEGTPARSFTQTQRAKDAAVRAAAEADRQHAAERRATAARTIPTGAREALAAIFNRNRQTRATERHARTIPVLP